MTINGLVDIVEQWVKKGDRLYVEGRIEYSQTEGDGGPKYWTDIVVTEMVMLGSSGGGGTAIRANLTSRSSLGAPSPTTLPTGGPPGTL